MCLTEKIQAKTKRGKSEFLDAVIMTRKDQSGLRQEGKLEKEKEYGDEYEGVDVDKNPLCLRSSNHPPHSKERCLK